MNTPSREEKWKQIAGYEGLYDVSSLGRVRSYRIKGSRNKAATSPDTCRILIPVTQPSGHAKVTLYRGGLRSEHYLSGLILDAFSSSPVAYFIDGDSANLAASNLRYGSLAEVRKRRR
jgi:hypothetical protein